MSVWALAARNIARNTRRSLLTGGVMVFGFAAVALAGGFMAQSLEGLREGTIRNGVGHVQFAREETFAGGVDAGLEFGVDRAADVERVLRQDPQVVDVLARIDFVGLSTNGTKSVPFLGTGVDPLAEARAMDLPKVLAAGRWLAGGSERGAVLGTGLARSLSVEVGDTLTLLSTTADGTLNALDVVVTGLADIPIKELDDRYLATTIAVAGELLAAPDRVSKLVVVLRTAEEAAPARLRLAARLRDSGFTLAGRTWEELALFYGQVRLLYLGIFGFMGAVLVVVVLLAATNTMVMAVSERTREIGTLRALGTRPARIRRMLLAEGALLALLSCVAGAGLSLVVRALLNHSGIILPPPPGVTHGMPLHVKLYGASYALGTLAMLATSLLASYFPARRASRLSIVAALAHV